jgi:hypothetical protein
MEVRPFLEKLLSLRSSAADKKVFFDGIQEMQQQPVELDSFLDAVLAELDSVHDKYWANLRYPVPLPSYRVKLGTLLRLLTSILKAESSEGKDEDLLPPMGKGLGLGARIPGMAAAKAVVAKGGGEGGAEGGKQQALTLTQTQAPIQKQEADDEDEEENAYADVLPLPPPPVEYASARRRRALLIILGQLETARGIVQLERYAAQSCKASRSMEEMLKRTPGGLETPTYEVLERYPNWEVRTYRDFTVASTVMNINGNSTTGAVGGGAFNSLAGYIFGSNQGDERMSMTTPVITTPVLGSEDDGTTKMSFVLPSRFWGDDEVLQAAPKPLSESDVVLETEGGGLAGADAGPVAVLWFGGYATKTEVEKRTNELRSLIRAYPAWKATPGPQPFLLQYNDPFQPPWKRRNEIVIPVEPSYSGERAWYSPST